MLGSNLVRHTKKMDEIFSQIKIFFEQNPAYSYLLFTLVFLIYGIGNFMNKDWATNPANSTQKLNYETFGHNAFRFGRGLLFILGAIAGIFGFLWSIE